MAKPDGTTAADREVADASVDEPSTDRAPIDEDAPAKPDHDASDVVVAADVSREGASSLDASGPVAKRLIVFYTPHGTLAEEWRPTGGETDFVLRSILEPLTPFRSRIIVLEGLDNGSAPNGEASHSTGAATLLTGLLGTSFQDGGPFQPWYRGGGPSLDHAIATAAGSGPKLQEIHLTAIRLNPPEHTITYGGANDLILPELDPRVAYPAVLGTAAPAALATVDPTLPDNVPAVGRAHMDLVVDAFAKGTSATASIMWGGSFMNTPFHWLGIADGFTTLAHETAGAGSPTTMDFTKVQTWFATQFAYLLNRLETIPEGGATMLDNTLVIWVSEAGSPPAAHATRNIPVVLAGNVAGRFRTGRYLKVDRQHSDLLLTIAQAFGLSTFGDPAAKPITELLAAP
jgi:hypothetical protein